MASEIAIQIPRLSVKEGTGFSATAYFRNLADSTSDTPADVRYRVDCLTTGRTVQDWTTATPGTSATIAITGANNAILNQCNVQERKQLTVQSDVGASDQCTGTVEFTVENVDGIR